MGTPGGSSSHTLYVSRPSAVLDREDGITARNMPAEVMAATTYSELRSNLASYAWAREESEASLHRQRGSRGAARSHYRCVLSFENDLSTASIKRLVHEWLETALPLSSACAFVHRNTDHVHAHVWIDARGTDGKKLDISKREWKTLGERWSRLYLKEMARVERLETKLGEGISAHDKDRTPRTPHRNASGAQERTRAQPALTSREQEALRCTESGDRAFREALRLREDLEGMGIVREQSIDRFDRR